MKTKPPKRAYLGRCGTESKKQMKTKEKSLRELLADIQKASELERYDPAADLALLAAQYRKLSRWDFGKLLDGMAAKYANEWSAIHAALAEKARAGDLDAIRLYRETMAQAGGGNEVTIVDDI